MHASTRGKWLLLVVTLPSLCMSGTQSGKVVIPDRLASATFGQLLELAGSFLMLSPYVLKWPPLAASVTPKRFPRDASVSVSVCQCVSVGVFFFYSDLLTRLGCPSARAT